MENNIFYHPELKFQFPVPAGWKHQNSPQQFQMAAPDGKAMMLLTLAPGESLEAAAQADGAAVQVAAHRVAQTT